MTRTTQRGITAVLLALGGAVCIFMANGSEYLKIVGYIVILLAVLVIYTMPAMRNFRWYINTKLKFNLDDPRWVFAKFETTTYPRFLSNEKHHLGITVVYGGDKGLQGSWSFALSKKRGVSTHGGGDYLTTFSWHYFDGMPDANDFEQLWAWLHKHNMDDMCNDATALVKEMYIHVISHAKAYL